MKLLATGLCVRAARNVRLASIAVPARSNVLPRITNVRRYASAEASAEQPVPQHEHSIRKNESKIPTAKQPSRQEHGSQKKSVTIQGREYALDDASNLSSAVTSLIGRNLYDQPNHPLCITRKLIESVFSGTHFANHVAFNPVATIEQNFDILGFPADHPGRARTDTYYVNSGHVLRTHTSAHQHQAFQHLANTKGKQQGYTICADVYRRDSIDRSHFPVFHQMEGALVWTLPQDRDRKAPTYQKHKTRVKEIVNNYKLLESPHVEATEGLGPHMAFDLETNPPQTEHTTEEVRVLVTHLRRSLEKLVGVVFDKAREAGLGDEAIREGEKLQVRWVEAYFPFTSPSFELEILWHGEWMELLGCGIVQDKILKNAGLKESIGWAWGIGVERLAMILFGVPDIRLFWSEDPRFLSQFQEGKITKFIPFSKYPACYKDFAFWVDAPAAITGSDATTGAAAAAGGDATKASPSKTQPAAFHENDMMEIVRDEAGSLAEDVAVVDEFVHPTTGRKSVCYRINYRSLERTLTNEEVNAMHEKVVKRVVEELGVEMR